MAPEPGFTHAGDRGEFVLVGGVAADADRANHLALVIEREHPARHRNEAAIRRRGC